MIFKRIVIYGKICLLYYMLKASPWVGGIALEFECAVIFNESQQSMLLTRLVSFLGKNKYTLQGSAGQYLKYTTSEPMGNLRWRNGSWIFILKSFGSKTSEFYELDDGCSDNATACILRYKSFELVNFTGIIPNVGLMFNQGGFVDLILTWDIEETIPFQELLHLIHAVTDDNVMQVKQKWNPYVFINV